MNELDCYDCCLTQADQIPWVQPQGRPLPFDNCTSISNASNSKNAPPQPFSNPPPNHQLLTHKYNTLNKLVAEFNKYYAQGSFSVIKFRSENKIKDFRYSRGVLKCQKGKVRTSEAHSHGTSTSGVRCPWIGIARALKENNRRQTFKVRKDCQHHTFHNPEDFQKSKIFADEQVDFIKEYINRLTVRNCKLAVKIRKQFPGIIFTYRQLRNQQYRLRKKALKGYNPFPTTIQLLHKKEVSFKAKWAEPQNKGDIRKKPKGLFQTTDLLMREWSHYPQVQLYDNTYHTNNKGLTFFQIVTLNHLSIAFSYRFSLINNKGKEGFKWLIKQVNKYREKASAKVPIVTITDYDTAIQSAMLRYSPQDHCNTALSELCPSVAYRGTGNATAYPTALNLLEGSCHTLNTLSTLRGLGLRP